MTDLRRHSSRCLGLMLVLMGGAASCADVPTYPITETASAGRSGSSPRIVRKVRHIVTLAASEDPRRVAAEYGVEPGHVYTRVMNGFAGVVSEAAREGMLRDARVVSVHKDVTLFHQEVSSPQVGAPWGLDRIDQRENALDGSYAFGRTGAGVTVYVVDSGIRYTHADFGGRARPGFDAFGGDGSDCLGHGTHVAGTVGGATYGVAKRAELVSVKILNCGGWGSGSDMIAGLDWIAADREGPAVANMSFAFQEYSKGGKSPLDQAVQNLINAGVAVVAAAANYSTDACEYTPARVPDAITVGATGRSDRRSSFSNWGRCVDLFAPGDGIVSASYSSDVGGTSKSGTSMSAPHAAGVAALALEADPTATPHEVADVLLSWATRSAVLDAKSTNDHLLFSGGHAGGSPENQPPTAAFSFDCEGLSCRFADQSDDADGILVSRGWSFAPDVGSELPDPTFTFDADGTHPVSLTVLDDDGASASVTRDVTVSSAPAPNQPPTARFSYACEALECRFTDESSDLDGALTIWAWTFGPGAAGSTDPNPTHRFAEAGTYQVVLTVSDDAGGAATAQQSVSVSAEAPPPAGIQLDLTTAKTKGQHQVMLVWSGATGESVDLYRDGGLIASIANTGAHIDEPGGRGRVTYRYRVCEAASAVCSAETEIAF